MADPIRAWGLALVLGLSLYNNLASFIPQGAHNQLYVPVNLAATAILLAGSRYIGLTWGDLGFRPPSIRRALGWGITLGLIIGSPILLAAVVPDGLRQDSEFMAQGARAAGALPFVALVRIPLGTALFEEVAFRGALYGTWHRIRGLRGAVIVSSLIFGIWHIGPTYRMLQGGAAFENPWLLGLGVTGGVLATVVGGLFFAWIRHRTASVYAPILTHWMINALGALAAFLVG